MNRPERRGAKYLERPTKAPKVYKRPIDAYVHYMSAGGDLVCFKVVCAQPARLTPPCRSDVVSFYVLPYVEEGARLIELPSQRSTEYYKVS